jgi:glutamine amidotransferase
MSSLTVVDLGTGNLHSVAKAVEYAGEGVSVRVSSDPAVIRSADRVILPGQGAVGTWFKALGAGELRNAIDEVIKSRPLLGICLGLQALFDFSDEDEGTPGLGVLPGRVMRFSPPAQTNGLKVPHMGWNNVNQSQQHPIWKGIGDGERFYFVHSYYAVATHQEDEIGGTVYGHSFTSAAASGGVAAVQFHPEKSASAGIQLLRNFLAWSP